MVKIIPMNFRICLILLLLMITYTGTQAQGCSDAGFCTAGSLGMFSTSYEADEEDNSKKKHSYRITQSIGIGEDDVLIITSYLDVYLQLHERIQFQVRGPIHMARTKDARTVSIGDIFLMNTIRAIQKEKHALSANVGVKLPTNQSNLTWKDSILPMAYQTSLGTFDAVLSLNHTWRHRLGALSSAIGYQQPFFHINHNKAPETKEFRRKADILVRADQVFNIKKKVDIGAGVLYIYHSKNDTRLNVMDVREEIAGSKGSTLNITAMLNWRVSNSFELGTTFGMPVLVRDARPDGLTRSFVINPYVQFNF
jgi:hypothetical protein